MFSVAKEQCNEEGTERKKTRTTTTTTCIVHDIDKVRKQKQNKIVRDEKVRISSTKKKAHGELRNRTKKLEGRSTSLRALLFQRSSSSKRNSLQSSSSSSLRSLTAESLRDDEKERTTNMKKNDSGHGDPKNCKKIGSRSNSLRSLFLFQRSSSNRNSKRNSLESSSSSLSLTLRTEDEEGDDNKYLLENSLSSSLSFSRQHLEVIHPIIPPVSCRRPGGILKLDGETKKVEVNETTFDTISIRYFPNILGDNPSVTEGVPICLSWNYYLEKSFDLDDYELKLLRLRRRRPILNPSPNPNPNPNPCPHPQRFRQAKKGRSQLKRLSVQERSNLLLKQGVTLEELALCHIQVQRIKKERAETVRSQTNIRFSKLFERLLQKQKLTTTTTTTSSSSSW